MNNTQALICDENTLEIVYGSQGKDLHQLASSLEKGLDLNFTQQSCSELGEFFLTKEKGFTIRIIKQKSPKLYRDTESLNNRSWLIETRKDYHSLVWIETDKEHAEYLENIRENLDVDLNLIRWRATWAS